MGDLFPAEPWQPEHWPLCRDLAAHASTAADRDRGAAGGLLAEGIDGYPASVATTWLLHHDQLAEDHAEHHHATTAATGGLLGSLGLYLSGRAEYEVARATQQRALAINATLFGPDHPQVARKLGNLGNVHISSGRLRWPAPPSSGRW